MALAERLAAAKAAIEQLKTAIEAQKARLANGSLSDASTSARRGLRGRNGRPMLELRHSLQGHFNKVYALDWYRSAGGGEEADRLCSASQDGKLIVWNARTRHKLNVVSLKSAWVMTAAFEPFDHGRLVAAGGLDNVCSIYDVRSRQSTGLGPGAAGGGGGAGAGTGVGSAPGASAPGALTGGGSPAVLELQGHEGYVSCARFVTPTSMLTASGDSTCILWDLVKGTDVAHFTDHAGDVMSLSVQPTNPNVFVSGSCDTTARVWDTRARRCVQTFVGHKGDVNSVRFMPHGLSFGTGSEDSTVAIFDLRSYARLNELGSPDLVASITSIDFSKSGRVVFAGYDDCNCLGWDVLADAASTPVFSLQAHTSRVSCVGVHASGGALATGSWDSQLLIWA